MVDGHAGEIHCLALDRLGERYRRYRLPDPDAEAAMTGSVLRSGQSTPLAVCLREETCEIVDGFKRLAAARTLGLKTIAARPIEADERAAKAAVFGRNQTGRPPREWQEAWIVHALVREDGMTQVEVAELLGHPKTWVCRRLALVEKRAGEVRDDLRLGPLSTTAARSLVRLPAGNQPEVLAMVHREELTVAALEGSVGSLAAAPARPQQEYILTGPREALRQARSEIGWAWDPRLSRTGLRVAQRRTDVLEGLGRLERRLRLRGRAALTPCDRLVLTPAFARLARDAQGGAALADDFLGELQTHDRANAR